MKKSLQSILTISFIATSISITAQNLTTVSGLRLYEHHSSEINNGADFGTMANGFQSGYDFVNRVYYYSFNKNTFGPYTNGENMNIDMVEHNGPYGNGATFGFTSAVSSIWNNEIKGNDLTLWMKAPSGFDYANLNTVNGITTAFNSSQAAKAVSSVANNDVYLGRIRNTNLFVAMKVTNVVNTNAVSGPANVYFDFEYKYGVDANSSISKTNQKDIISVYPNPASGIIYVNCENGYRLYNNIGTLIMESLNPSQSIDISGLPAGVYMISSGQQNARFIKTN